MSTQNRRSAFPSSLAKRQASSSSSNVGKFPVAEPRLAKKRAPLGNLTNRSNVPNNASKSSLVCANLGFIFFLVLVSENICGKQQSSGKFESLLDF